MLQERFTNLIEQYRLTPEQQTELGKVAMACGDAAVEQAAIEIASRPTVLPLNKRPGFYETDRGRKELERNANTKRTS
jgi:hypothetical protein